MSAPGTAREVSESILFRDAMANVASTVTVVTSIVGAQPQGATVSAFMSLSLDPPMVVVALARISSVLETIRAARVFGVNVLGSSQADVATRFARGLSADKFAQVAWHVDAGVPRIAGAPGWLVCSVVDLVDAGDHTMVCGAVDGADTKSLGAPLTYHRRTFGTHLSLGEPAPFFDLWT